MDAGMCCAWHGAPAPRTLVLGDQGFGVRYRLGPREWHGVKKRVSLLAARIAEPAHSKKKREDQGKETRLEFEIGPLL